MESTPVRRAAVVASTALVRRSALALGLAVLPLLAIACGRPASLPAVGAPSVSAVERPEGGSYQAEARVRVARPAPPVLAPFGANRLVIPGGTSLPVVGYDDCTSQAEITHAGAALDSCFGSRAYFVGHNPGPFTPLMDAAAGDVIEYGDQAGILHRYRIVGIRTWSRWAGAPPPVQPDVVAQFQTCVTIDGNWDRILDAVEVPNPAPS